MKTSTLHAIDRVLQQEIGTLASTLDDPSEPIARHVIVDLKRCAGETAEDLACREQLAHLAASLSVVDVYRVLIYIDRLPDRQAVESVSRAAASAFVDGLVRVRTA